ncbi:hypothetical protein LR48_Vigan11g020600 [Vigna angularis]|uniref:Uncharacterized protein n=1 Tax=Phaseolus angularis TaxID=3914 RepID=A0A0L9VQY9_PHAAN|nr:hypothetical protein LR48_Vigan11g020600 [Vigna angularis]
MMLEREWIRDVCQLDACCPLLDLGYWAQPAVVLDGSCVAAAALRVKMKRGRVVGRGEAGCRWTHISLQAAGWELLDACNTPLCTFLLSATPHVLLAVGCFPLLDGRRCGPWISSWKREVFSLLGLLLENEETLSPSQLDP